MDNYICINGKRIELTNEQLATLGVSNPLTLAQLSEWARSGEAANHVKVHDRIMVSDMELEIVGIGQDTDENGCTNTVTLRTTAIVDNRCMNDGTCNGWRESSMRSWLNNELLNSLPDEIKKYVRPVKKQCRTCDGASYEVVDTIWLFSESELFGSAIYSPGEEGKRYEAFATSADRQVSDDDGDTCWYWERSPYSSHGTSFCIVDSSGTAGYAYASCTYGVALGFCV